MTEPHSKLRTRGRMLSRRMGDVLAYVDLPGTSNGPTEAINESARTLARVRP